MAATSGAPQPLDRAAHSTLQEQTFSDPAIAEQFTEPLPDAIQQASNSTSLNCHDMPT